MRKYNKLLHFATHPQHTKMGSKRGVAQESRGKSLRQSLC
jgi:hypothetical protein